MRLIKMDKQVKLIATKGIQDKINFYILTAKNEKLYAFTRPYSDKIWALCRSGIAVNDLMRKKTRHKGVMLLAKYARYIMPYLCEEYGLAAA